MNDNALALALLLFGCGGAAVTSHPDAASGGGTDAGPISTDFATTPPADAGVDDAGGGGTTDMSPSKSDMSSSGNQAANRPSYNTGDGFFVLNGKLYDPKGKEFRIRGVDRCHYDSDSEAGIKKSGANAVRVFVSTQYGQTWSGLAGIVQNQHIANQQLAIPTIPNSTAGTGTSCNQDNSVLTDVVGQWVASKSDWTPMNAHMMINVANEWGPSNSTVWRDQYIAAIKTLRGAGYTGPILVDSGGCGQNTEDLLTYAQAVFTSDSQKNIVFSFHLYGGTSATQMPTFFAQLGALQKSSGMVFIIGEFGPGANVGPSPTEITPAQVITAAESNDLGWIGWAWDDNNLSGGKSSNDWFSMTLAGPGIYTQESDLTDFGKDVVLNSTYGLSVLAKPPTW